MRLLDDCFAGLVIAIIAFTPWPLGAVHPWPASVAEIGTFALMIVWAWKIAMLLNSRGEVIFVRFWPLVLPVSLLTGLFLLQLIPLPANIMRLASPSTSRIYLTVLQERAQADAYSDGAFVKEVHKRGDTVAENRVLSNVVKARKSTRTSKTGNEPLETEMTEPSETAARADRSKLGTPKPPSDVIMTTVWHPLSLARSLTETAFLRFTAYCALFFVVLSYPFTAEPEAEDRFMRLVIASVLIMGFMVGLVGICERIYWNGKILWFLVPLDWDAPLVSYLPRASGPFVDPDHFAGYLVMSLPLSIAGALFGCFSADEKYSITVRVSCVVITLVLITAIVLSSSRAGWIEAGGSVIILCYRRFMIVPLRKEEDVQISSGGSRRFRRDAGRVRVGSRSTICSSFGTIRKSVALGASLTVLLLAISISLVLIGPEGRIQGQVRLDETVANGEVLGTRPIVWSETLEMIRAFPVFGIGLAAWPEFFPHYQKGPWNSSYFRQTHNDYLQFAAECGLIGVAGFLWFAYLVGKNLMEARGKCSQSEYPILVALSLALGSMALHEFVDFPLRIPANALLFTLLLAIVVRMAITRSGHSILVSQRHIVLRVSAGGTITVGAILIVLSLVNNGRCYPDDIPYAGSLPQARAVVVAHPVSARAHLSLLELGGPTMDSGTRLREMAITVWLDPTNPAYRDLYAITLAQMGHDKEALEQVRESVYQAPVLREHVYLSNALISWTLPAQQNAIEQGFKRAIADGFPGAVEGLGAFYDAIGRLSDEARLYQAAAGNAPSNADREEFLIAAGEVEVRTWDPGGAEAFYRQAIRVEPADPEPYTKLIAQVYGPAREFDAAKAVAIEAARNVDNATRVYLALASAAEDAREPKLTENALLKAVVLEPSFDVIMRLGRFYLGVGELGKAESTLQSAVENCPQSAEASYLLGVAEDRDYEYSEAEKAYARAATLDPQKFRDAYLQFRNRTESARTGG